MRTEHYTVSTGLAAIFLAVLIGFSGIMCLNDAFALGAAPLPLLGICAVSALLAALSCLPRRSWPFGLLAAVVYLAVLLWKKTLFLDSFQAVAHRISQEYAQAFSAVHVVGEQAGDPRWVLLAAAVPLSWITARVIVREGSTLLVLLAALPVLVLSLLVVDLAPVLWLIVLTGGLLIVVVSHSIRERSRKEGSVLAWWLVLPTVILLCALTVLWPPADYVRSDWSEVLREMTQTTDQVTQRVENWSQSITMPRVQWSRELKTVDLKRLGPKRMTGQPVLEYRSDSRISYLRGVSLALYEDNAWNALPTEEYEAYGLIDNPQLNSAVMVSTLEIETLTRAPQLYTTYYLASVPEDGVLIDDAYVANEERLTAYRLLYEPSLQFPLGTSDAADQLAAEVYTRLPEPMEQPLRTILEENGLENGSAEEIIDYVRSCGVYDLNTPAIPEGEDFVLYFLQESRRGYCVHFASSAVLLLRSAGIPARYVTGYAVSGAAGQWDTVTEDDAHAWVEYYTTGIGWRPLDPTPADASDSLTPDVIPEREPMPVEPDETPSQPELPETEKKLPETVPETSRGPSGKVLCWLLVLPCLAAALWLRRMFGIRYRLRRCRKGQPNRRAMAYWRWLVQLSKADGTPIEEELLCLAEKARFSQHILQEEEVAILHQAVETRIRSLKAAPPGKRLWWAYGRVLF